MEDDVLDAHPNTEPQPDEKCVCVYCKKTFKYNKDKYRHIRRVHKLEPTIEGLGMLMCPEEPCTELFATHSLLRKHLEVFHLAKIQLINKEFDTFSEFLNWKEEEQKIIKAQYFQRSGSKTSKDGITKYAYLCNRSGMPKLLEEGSRERKLKKQGSCKIGRTCSSSIVATVVDKRVFVEYYVTHIGHEKDLSYLKLAKDERVRIYGKLSQGTAFNVILDEVKNNQGEGFERIHLLRKQDLKNIKRDFGKCETKKVHSKGEESEELNIINCQTKLDSSKVVKKLETVVGYLNAGLFDDPTIEKLDKSLDSFIEIGFASKLKQANKLPEEIQNKPNNETKGTRNRPYLITLRNPECQQTSSWKVESLEKQSMVVLNMPNNFDHAYC